MSNTGTQNSQQTPVTHKPSTARGTVGFQIIYYLCKTKGESPTSPIFPSATGSPMLRRNCVQGHESLWLHSHRDELLVWSCRSKMSRFPVQHKASHNRPVSWLRDFYRLTSAEANVLAIPGDGRVTVKKPREAFPMHSHLDP